MKKLSKLLIVPLLTLVSCSKTKELSIISPTGAPAVCFYRQLENLNFATNTDAKIILAGMANQSYDIVVLPTNVGINAIQKTNLNYKVASIITFGNIFVASTGNDTDNVMDEDDYIVSFNEGSVPDLLFNDIYHLTGKIHYVPNAQEAAKCLKTKVDYTNDNHPVDYVVLAEPALTKLAINKTDFTIYSNIQEKYKKKYGGKEIYQAAIFVKNGADKALVDKFLDSIESDISNLLTSPNILEEYKSIENESVLGVDIDATVTSIEHNNTIGIGYKNALLVKDGIDTFLNIFGVSKTNEEIYYK